MQVLLPTTWWTTPCLLVVLELAAVPALLALEDLPVTNLGAKRTWLQGDWLVYLEQESFRGEDLNGDRDTEDAVCQVRKLSTGETKDLGLAAELIGFVSREWLVLEVLEDVQGEDLNGDGDTADRVLHAYEFVTGETRNLRISGNATLISESQMLLTIYELFAGSDLNGDGDFEDYVLHVHDLATGETSNLGLDLLVQLDLTASGEWVANTVSEREGGEDLNGDGDIADEVVHTLHVPTREITNLELSAGASILSNVQSSAAFKGDLLVFGVSERGQGEDLNGDGDTADDVIHLHDLSDDESTSLELAGFVRRVFDPTPGEDWLVLDILEREQGEDLNGDGDTADEVIHLYHHSTGEIRNLGLHGFSSSLSDRWLTFSAYEREQGEDLNSDGDTEDQVVHVHDLLASETTNLGLAGFPFVADLRSGFVAIGLDEDAQREDLNGDGDLADWVMHVHDLSSGETVNLELAYGGHDLLSRAKVAGGWLVFDVREKRQGEDLDGDGHVGQADVLHLRDLSVGETTNLGLIGYVRDVTEEFLVMEFPEWSHGDLNGDGHLEDRVDHLVDLRGVRGGRQLPGDCNQDALLDTSDAIGVFRYLFLADSAALPCGDGSLQHEANLALFDWQPDGQVDLSDGIRSLQFLFSSGPPHPLGSDCVPASGCEAACPDR